MKRSVLSYDYPKIFLDHPGLMRIIYVLSYIYQLRKWYLQPLIAKKLRSLPDNFSFIDAGSGEGQYLFTNARRHENATFTGIDKSQGNINFCNAYISKRPFRNVRIIHSLIEDAVVAPADVVLCVGVLLYVANDAATLRSLRNMLKPGGTLILETPVNGKNALPAFITTPEKFPGYSTIHGRERIYLPQQVLDKVTDAGFTITTTRYAYGYLGRFAHELYYVPVNYIMHGNLPSKIIAIIGFYIILPFVILFSIIDFLIPKNNGNTIIIVAEKK